MPRARKTQSGDKAQKIESVAGQRYGEGVEQQAMQRAMPAPNVRAREESMRSVPVAANQPGMGVEQTVRAPAVNPMDFLAALPRNTLNTPTQNTRPVTNGLVQGPGGGPEVLRPFAQAAPSLRAVMRLAERTGDPVFEQILRRFS